MTQPRSAGHLDAAYFFRGIGQPGGFLAVRGWFCVLDQESLTLSAALWVEDTVVQIRCHEPRPAAAAANAAYSANSGFNVIIPISLEAKPELEVIINFSAGQQQCGSLAGRICHPDLEIEQHSGSLSELRLKKLRNLVLNERERLSHTERTTSMPVTGQIDPAFPCNLECPLCLSEMVRRQGIPCRS
jgi:hypothetical protein